MDEVEFDLELLKVIAQMPVGEWMKDLDIVISKKYGLIHKSAAVEIHGIKGFLIWDFVIYNEITFKDMNDNIVSLYRGFSDKETEDRWDEWVKKFGV